VNLPSRLKFGTHAPGTLPVLTESISRHMAVVHSGDSIAFMEAIRKDDEIALEIDLPERHPFSPRYLLCEGRVGFISRFLDDRIRLGMIVDRMQFRDAQISPIEPPAVIVRAGAIRSGGRAV
jgi:hypothetical protein